MKDCLLTVCSGLLLITLLASASAEEVWFAPPDNMDRGARTFNHDFPHLFDRNPAWDAKIDVFKISPKMGSTIGPAEQLTRINAFLKDRHIALAVDVGAMQVDNANPVPGECGYGVEGMVRPGRNAIQFRRLKQLGIEIRYVAMDEPLTFGHYYNKKNACRFSIDEVARRVAAAIAEIRQYYPDVRVVDVEAPQSMTAAQWNADFPKWLEAYRRATGQPLDAIVYDLDWRPSWQAVVVPGVRVARQAGIRVGIILDGAGKSDAEAVADYKKNMASVAALRAPLDIVMIANWTPHPANDLPQSDPNSLTGVLHYFNTKYHPSGAH
jgi:hypothetical protein